MTLATRQIDEHSMRLAAGLTGYALQIPVEHILSAALRDHRIARARQVAMYLAHVGLGMSLARIAYALGRDRSTVAYGCHKVEDFRDDPDIDEWLDSMEDKLKEAAALANWASGTASIPERLQQLRPS